MGRKRKSKRASRAKRTRRTFNRKHRKAKAKERSYRNSREQDPVYCQWRQDVKDRDGHCCQWPNCGSRMRIQVHHIKTWSKYPGLRFVVANGITLCERCHTSIRGREVHYEGFFLKLLETNMIRKLKSRKRSA